MNGVIVEILQESLLLFFLIGSLFALLLGLLFVFAPESAKRFSKTNNRWLSLRRTTRPLEVPHLIDRNLYRHHHLVGLFIILSSAYILYRLGFDYHHSQAVAALQGGVVGNGTTTIWLLESLLWFVLPMTIFFLFIGAAIAIKPSSLKGLEALSNRWLSTRKAMQPIERSNYSIDNWVEHHPRLFGSLLCVAASYNLTLLLLFLLNKWQ